MKTLESSLEHEVAEVICLKCLNRWIAVYPQDTLLKDIECKCGFIGAVIKTGQTLNIDTDDETMKNDVRYQNMVTMWGEKIAKRKYREFCLTQ